MIKWRITVRNSSRVWETKMAFLPEVGMVLNLGKQGETGVVRSVTVHVASDIQQKAGRFEVAADEYIQVDCDPGVIPPLSPSESEAPASLGLFSADAMVAADVPAEPAMPIPGFFRKLFGLG